MWLDRARTLGYVIVSNSRFASLPLWKQEEYVNQIKSSVSTLRQDNYDLNQAMTHADMSATNFKLKLKLNLSDFIDDPLAYRYSKKLEILVLNSTTIYKHNELILDIIELLSKLNYNPAKTKQIHLEWQNLISHINHLELFIQPANPLITQRGVWHKIKQLVGLN